MKTTRICPKCKSTKVSMAREGFLSVMGMTEHYICDNCGFASPMFPEIDTSELDALKKKTRQESNEDNNY